MYRRSEKSRRSSLERHLSSKNNIQFYILWKKLIFKNKIYLKNKFLLPYFQLGIGKGTDDVSEFVEISSLKKYKIKHAYAGFNHSLFQTEDGKVLPYPISSTFSIFSIASSSRILNVWNWSDSFICFKKWAFSFSRFLILNSCSSLFSFNTLSLRREDDFRSTALKRFGLY